MLSRLRTFLIEMSLRLRARTIVPLRSALRRRAIARASGLRQVELRAAYAWWRGEALPAMAFWSELEQAEPQRESWPVKIAQAASERGDFETAERTLLDAQARGIRSEALESNLLRYGRMSRRSNAAVGDAEAIVADPEASPAKVFFSAFYLMAQNRLGSARAGFERAPADSEYGPLARGQLAAVGLLEQARAEGRQEVRGWVSPAESSVLVREPASDTLVVGFTLPMGTLGLAMNAVHAMLSSTGVNALYLYDTRQVYHLRGTDRFGPGYQAMLDGIKAVAAELGTKRLITVGGSATGYTAIRAAMDLDADGALVFSPATLMLPDANPAVARGAHNLLRLRELVLPMMKDLRPLVKARTTCPRIEIYYSASNQRDIMHAHNLAGLPGVTLHAVPGLTRHDCLTEMASRGYRDLLKSFPAL